LARNEDPTRLQLELLKLQELVNERSHALDGDSSERRASASTSSTGSSEDDDATSSTGHGPTEQPDLPVITDVCELDEADKICPKCGGERYFRRLRFRTTRRRSMRSISSESERGMEVTALFYSLVG